MGCGDDDGVTDAGTDAPMPDAPPPDAPRPDADMMVPDAERDADLDAEVDADFDAEVDADRDGGPMVIYPLPVPESGDVTSQQEFVAACARARSCFGSDAVLGVSECVAAYPFYLDGWARLDATRTVRCVNSARSDCDAVRRCYSAGADPEPCDAAGFEEFCDGETAVRCDRVTSQLSRSDCATLGLTCAKDSLGNAQCSLGPCDETTGDTASRCDGQSLVRCDRSLWIFEDCDTMGLRCLSDADGTRCAGSGGSCPAGASRRCDGDTLDACIGGHQARIDCSSDALEGWTCGGTGDGSDCQPAGTECASDPILGSTLDESCEGTSLTYCRDGVVSRLSCTELGFTSCVDPGMSAGCE